MFYQDVLYSTYLKKEKRQVYYSKCLFCIYLKLSQREDIYVKGYTTAILMFLLYHQMIPHSVKVLFVFFFPQFICGVTEVDTPL